MSRQRKLDSAAAVARGVDAYFAHLERKNREQPERIRYPTWPGLCCFLGVGRDTLARWVQNEDGQYPGYAEVLQRAAMRLQDALEQAGMSDPKKAGFLVFLLKQKQYGGYTDKPAADALDVRVELRGMGGQDAFG